MDDDCISGETLLFVAEVITICMLFCTIPVKKKKKNYAKRVDNCFNV